MLVTLFYLFICLKFSKIKRILPSKEHCHWKHVVKILNKTTFCNNRLTPKNNYTYKHTRLSSHILSLCHIIIIITITIKANGTLAQMCWSKIRRTGNTSSFSSSTSELFKKENTSIVYNTPTTQNSNFSTLFSNTMTSTF